MVRCFQASDPIGGHVSIIDMHNSLNINFTGIHALEYLFSVKFYEKWDRDEISRTILKFEISMVKCSWRGALHKQWATAIWPRGQRTSVAAPLLCSGWRSPLYLPLVQPYPCWWHLIHHNQLAIMLTYLHQLWIIHWTFNNLINNTKSIFR